MELRHVLGNTWAAEANTALLPVYKINDRDIVLIDTGYAKLDRAGLTAMIEAHGFRLLGVICSHAHFDHSGNVRYLQQRYGAKAAAHIIEAGISVNPDAYRANYVALTYGKRSTSWRSASRRTPSSARRTNIWTSAASGSAFCSCRATAPVISAW